MQNAKCLVVVHRKHAADDFYQISRRINKIDKSIKVLMVKECLTSKMLPDDFHNLPMLVIYLVNPPPTEFKVATKLAVKYTNKLEEYSLFKQAGIPCLPITKFEWGMELDESEYGDWVVLKPSKIQSTGKDVNRIPTKQLSKIRPEDFPQDHLIHKDEYYVQKFIRTGNRPVHHRVCVFLGEILYSTRSEMVHEYPDENSDIETMLSRSVASNLSNQRQLKLHIDHDVNQLASDVGKLLPQFPLIGLDIIRDGVSGNLYVLEGNLGGNTWHFSSEIGKVVRADAGGRNAMVGQYMAWDRAADALIRATHALAT